jgi:hypothetical protein
MKSKLHTIYKTSNGKRVVGVTTILGVLAKPALIHWAWDLGCKGVDYRKFRDDKADIGTLAHYLIMQHLKNEPIDTSDYSSKQIDQAENCILSFYEWEKAYKIEPVLIEQPLISERHKYGGTCDLLAKVGNETWLIDFKTGKAIYEEMAIQLSAYRQLVIENNYDVSNARIVRIGRDEDEGFEVKIINNLDKQFELFKHCLEIYQLRKEIKKGD